MAKKIIKIRDKDVTVDVQPDKHGQGFLLLAKCDFSYAEHSLTVGAESAVDREAYDTTDLQRDLDRARQRVAEEAEWKARVWRMVKEVT